MKYFKSFFQYNENFSRFDLEQMQIFVELFNTEDLHEKVKEHLHNSQMTKGQLYNHYSNVLKMCTSYFESVSGEDQDIVLAYCIKLKKVLEVLSTL